MGLTRAQQTNGVGAAILRYAPSRFFEPLLALVSIPILTRVFGTAGYGDFSVLIVTVGLVRVLSFDWINNCALRFYRPMKAERRAYHSNLLVGLSLGVVTSLGLVFWVVGALPGKLGEAFIGCHAWVFMAVAAEGLARNVEMSLRAMQKPLAFSLVRAGLAFARHAVGLACLLIADKSVAAYLGGWAFSSLLIALFAWAYTGTWRSFSPGALSLETVRRFALFGLPVALVLVANSMQTLGTRYVLQYMCGSEATGLFSAAYNIGGAPVMLFQSIVMLGLYPLAIDAFEKEGHIHAIARDGLRYFALVALPLVLLLALLAHPTLRVISGESYGEAWPALSIISVGTFAYGLSQYFSLTFLVRKQTLRMAAINVTGALANISLALWLAPRFGFVAAAWATTMAYLLIMAGAMIWGLERGRSTLPLTSFARCSLACVPIVIVWLVVTRYLHLSSFLECCIVCVVGGCLYLLGVWKTSELDPEVAVARRYLRRIRGGPSSRAG